MATIGPDAPLAVLKSVFKKYDKDNSGSVTVLEFKSLCYDLGYYMSNDEIKIALEILDKDGSGTIDQDEFITFWRDNNKFKKIESAQGERVQQGITYFRYFDKDHSGRIGAEEYAQLHADLIKNNLISPNLTAEQGLKLLDKSGDKQVSFNEFINYLDSVQSQ